MYMYIYVYSIVYRRPSEGRCGADGRSGALWMDFARLAALNCTHYMESNKLYSLSPNEDITILNLRSKLIILDRD